MPEIAGGTTLLMPRRRYDMRELSRLATWGLAALGALTLATYAASSDLGEDRLIVAIAHIRGVPPPERLARAPADRQNRQIAEAVRELSNERESLIARLDTLERNLGDITGSIRSASIAPPASAAPAAQPEPVPAITPPETVSVPITPPLPLPKAAAEEPAAGKTEFGIDLGRANSVEALRQLWTGIQGRHGAALEGLRPIVAVREIARAGGVELRLVAGPIPNAAAAARLCASLAGTNCHPTVFDGQKLALR